jgi:hypothetical protein
LFLNSQFLDPNEDFNGNTGVLIVENGKAVHLSAKKSRPTRKPPAWSFY